MADVLENSTDILEIVRRLLSKQQILDLAQRARFSIIDKMVPSTCITIQHSRSFDDLPSIFFPTPLALECVVCVARGIVAVLKELAERIKTEMSLDVFRRVDDTR